jgi:MOSC domain-containing protein YiiM
MEFKALFENFSQEGVVVYISIRPNRREPVQRLENVNAIQDKGLQGDRYNNMGGARQVTLIQAEHLMSIASFLGKKEVDPDLIRRNIVITGTNLLALKGKTFKVGQAILEYSGECHPCSRMEENLGFGGYNAMRGMGGITAKVVRSGPISIGDAVTVIS